MKRVIPSSFRTSILHAILTRGPSTPTMRGRPKTKPRWLPHWITTWVKQPEISPQPLALIGNDFLSQQSCNFEEKQSQRQHQRISGHHAVSMDYHSVRCLMTGLAISQYINKARLGVHVCYSCHVKSLRSIKMTAVYLYIKPGYHMDQHKQFCY